MQDITSLSPNILIALATGHHKVARTALVRLLEEDRRNAAGWLALAVTLPREQALQAVRRAVALEPDNPLALQSLVRLQTTTQPDFRLSLHDVWQQEGNGEEENPSLFAREQPTMQLRTGAGELYAAPGQEAVFGEECATLPIAFHDLFNFRKAAEAEAAKLPFAIADPPTIRKPSFLSPERKKAANQPAETPEKKKVSAAPSKPEPAEKPVSATATLDRPFRRPTGIRRPFDELPPVVHSYQPTVDGPLTEVNNQAAAAAAAPVAARKVVDLRPAKPLITNTVEQPVNYTSGKYNKTDPYWQFQTVPGGDGLKTPRTMPRLESGPRPQLGATQEPLFGLTAFGFLMIVLILCLVVLLFLTMR